MKVKINKNKLLKRSILLLLLMGILGAFIANRMVKSVGFDNLGDFISNYWSNRSLAAEGDPIKLTISISDEDYQFIENKREEALKRGVQINVGDNYVDCELQAEDKTVKGLIRLKGHMTDHLEGDKWSYRVKTEEPIMGMYRFSLQHPGTRNYAYEWVYHQLLARENVINLKYDFIDVKMHDKELGIYAVEEHFGQHVLEHNDRPKGAILRWNPGLYWESRIDELNSTYLDEEYSDYSSSFAEPYDKGVVKSDPELIQTYQEGARLLEAFRRDSLSVSEVFDVQKMASFHAIIDLVGGYHSLDWSDVKFFYNSESKKVEPVGYESFSIRESVSIAGQRTPNVYEGVEVDYHNKLFADPMFFAEYIKAIERICDESYMNEFIESIEEEHRKKLAILAIEWPYRQFTFDPYFENIDLIRHNLVLPKAFHAFLEPSNDSVVNMSFAPVSDYPIEFVSIEINGKEVVDVEDFVLPAKARGEFATYFPLSLKYDSKSLKNIVVSARIPGSKLIFKVDVNEYPSYKGGVKMGDSAERSVHLSTHPDVVFDQQDSIYYFNAKDVQINSQYAVENAEIRILPNQQIHFQENGGLLVINSNLECLGGKDQEIVFESKSKGGNISMMNSKMVVENVVLIGSSEFIVMEESELFMKECAVADVENDFIQSKTSKITMTDCRFGSVGSVGDFDRSLVNMNKVTATNGDAFIKSNGSNFQIKSSQISNYSTTFSLKHLSIVRVWNSQMKENLTIAEINNNSEITLIGCELGRAETGFILDEEGINVKKSEFTLYKTDHSEITQLTKP